MFQGLMPRKLCAWVPPVSLQGGEGHCSKAGAQTQQRLGPRTSRGQNILQLWPDKRRSEVTLPLGWHRTGSAGFSEPLLTQTLRLPPLPCVSQLMMEGHIYLNFGKQLSMASHIAVSLETPFYITSTHLPSELNQSFRTRTRQFIDTMEGNCCFIIHGLVQSKRLVFMWFLGELVQ